MISGAGKISINFVCCREMMPDPGFYRECLQQAYDELEAAVRAGGKPGPRRKAAARARSKSSSAGKVKRATATRGRRGTG